jgi:hypothetical protein
MIRRAYYLGVRSGRAGCLKMKTEAEAANEIVSREALLENRRRVGLAPPFQECHAVMNPGCLRREAIC